MPAPDRQAPPTRTLPKAVLIRITALLLTICIGAFGWESSRDRSRVPVTGVVSKIEFIYGHKAYTARYSIDNDQIHSTVIRIGILDQLRRYYAMDLGASVQLRVDPKSPDQAVLDTLTGRYGITLTFFTLASIIFLTIAWMLFSKRLKITSGRS